jgi:recombinational DNA repair protein RecT
VPFWNSQRQQFECQPIVDYKGYIALAHRSKEVGRITSHIIYEKEPWEFSEGDVVIHKPLPPSQRGEKKVMVYAKAFDRAGILIAQEYLWAEEVEEIKRKSLENKKNKESNPWNTSEDAMWRKSPVRKLAKWMPMSSEMQKAAIIEEYREQGIDMPLLEANVGLDETPPATDAEQKTEEKANALKERLTQARDQFDVRDQSKTGAPPAGQPPKPGVEGTEATPEPHQENPGEVVDAEFEGDPGPSDAEQYGDQVGASSNPVIEGASKDRAPTDAAPSDPPPPPEEPKRSTAVHPSPKAKTKETFGFSGGPRIEVGKKPADYLLEGNMVKCPPGGEREGLLTNKKAYCDPACKMRRRCFLFIG